MSAHNGPLVRRGSQLVADALRAMIVHGELATAHSLPPEPELAARLGVSRHHLREALRLLEQDGLVKVRPGRNGGVFLTVPGVEVLTRTFSLILARTGTPLRDLMAARLVIEPAAAAIAATEATEDEIAALEAIVEQQRTQERYTEHLNTQFHVTLAAAAHNQTLLLMMRSIESLIRNIDVSVSNPELKEGSYRAHRAIVRAVRARDPERVEDLVRRHLRGFEDLLPAMGLDPDTHTVADLLQMAERTRRSRLNGVE